MRNLDLIWIPVGPRQGNRPTEHHRYGTVFALFATAQGSLPHERQDVQVSEPQVSCGEYTRRAVEPARVRTAAPAIRSARVRQARG
jgi:hypothetical protein